MLQQTHGAAALYAVTAAGLMELLPLPSEEPQSAAELAKTGGHGDVKVLQQLLHLLATCEILDELEDGDGKGGYKGWGSKWSFCFCGMVIWEWP